MLEIESIGTDDNFFELGGNSLQAAQIIARVRKQLRVEIPLRALFENPTVAQLSKNLEQASSQVESKPIPVRRTAQRADEVPPSSAQERLWFLNQLEPESPAYNICRAYQIKGACDIEKLRESFELIVSRHETLRTNFVARAGRPIAVIKPSIGLPFDVVDLKSLANADRQTEIDRSLALEAETPFDLAKDPLLRIKYLQLAEDESLLLLTIHHIDLADLARGLTVLRTAIDTN